MQKTIGTDRLHGSPPGTQAFIFDEVAGVEYRADVVRPYNTYGSTVRKLGPVLHDFYDRLDDWTFQVQELSGRRLAAVVSCSVWRRHPPRSARPVSSHTMGRGIDIGGVWWSRDDGITAWGYGDRRREAVALEATMRLYFGTVLGPTANKSHADHWHCDTCKPPAITWSELSQSARGIRKVEVVYLQESCSVVHGQQLEVDGIWGEQTRRAVHRVVSTLRVSSHDIRDPETYLAYNVATALVGFAQVEQLVAD